MPPPGITLRPITEDDAELLFRIYASTRTEELSVVPWSEAQKEAFLRMQFRAQHTHYRAHTPNADFLVVLKEGTPAGRLYLDRREDVLHIIDIALLPEARGTGIGGALLSEIIEEARASGRVVRIHVERQNRARHLYDRLGFRNVADDGGVYLLMEWSPPPAPRGDDVS
ncbi:MAG: GNAT family N-acetyltransferase [Myxococcaceae bacterium]